MKARLCERIFMANRVLCLRKLGYNTKHIFRGLRDGTQEHDNMLMRLCSMGLEYLEPIAAEIGEHQYLTFLKMYSLGHKIVLNSDKYNMERAQQDFILLGCAVSDITKTEIHRNEERFRILLTPKYSSFCPKYRG